MATSNRSLGISHVTVVPTNADQADDVDDADGSPEDDSSRVVDE